MRNRCINEYLENHIDPGAVIYLAVYLVLGMLLMNYDDFYDESKGEYWSLSSMTMSEKAITYIGLNVWHVINVVAIGYVLYRIVKTSRKRQTY